MDKFIGDQVSGLTESRQPGGRWCSEYHMPMLAQGGYHVLWFDSPLYMLSRNCYTKGRANNKHKLGKIAFGF
jgi:hypothetical protein